MSSEEFNRIMERLDQLEALFNYHLNPVNSYRLDEKAKIMRDAIASGDKDTIKAAKALVGRKS